MKVLQMNRNLIYCNASRLLLILAILLIGARAEAQKTLTVRGMRMECSQYNPEECTDPAERARMEELRQKSLQEYRQRAAEESALAKQREQEDAQYRANVAAQAQEFNLGDNRSAEATRLAEMKLKADAARGASPGGRSSPRVVEGGDGTIRITASDRTTQEIIEDDETIRAIIRSRWEHAGEQPRQGCSKEDCTGEVAQE